MEQTSGLERLRRLLGGPELAGLRRRLRARYERGELGDVFTLGRLTVAERRALEGLLGRASRVADSMRVALPELDEALQRAGLAPSLKGALELLDGAILDLKAQRLALERAWDRVLTGVEEPRLKALLADPAGAALLKRLSRSDPEAAQPLLAQVQRILTRLPEHGIPLAQLAAEALGNSHALDAGSPIATLVLRVRALGEKNDEDDERPREQWARVGVTVNELASPALCLNLPVRQLRDTRMERGDPPLGEPPVRYVAARGEPVHLSLRRLLRDPPDWAVQERDVFVCENPNIVAIAADRLGSACAPLVCTDGMPSAAQRALISQLATSGARLHYHGDFDWPGLRIANFVHRFFGAQSWRLGADDYLMASHGGGSPLNLHGRVEARWDTRLAAAMADRGLAIHEEAVAEPLLRDLQLPGGGD